MEHKNIIILSKEEYSTIWIFIGLIIGLVGGYALGKSSNE